MITASSISQSRIYIPGESHITASLKQ